MTVAQDPTPNRPTAASPSWVVFGRVLRAEGPPVLGVQVSALHRNLRSEIEIGRPVSTDASGSYAIFYEPPDGLRSLELVVRVEDPQLEREIARSSLICHARRAQPVDVVVGDGVYRGYSEFERLAMTLRPHLDGASVGALSAADVALLACKTGLDSRLVTQFADAHRYGELTGVGAAAFYGFLRQGLPTSLRALLSQRARVQGEALRNAVADNIVPAALASRIGEIVFESKQAAVKLALQTPDGQESMSLSGLLGTTSLTADSQVYVLTRYALHEGPIREFWSDLKRDREVGAQMVKELQFTLQLGTLAGGYAPLVRALRTKATAGEIGSVEDLVGWTSQEWLSLIDRTGAPPHVPGATPGDQAHNYAKILRGALERSFPTQAIVAGLHRTSQDGDEDLLTFLDDNPQFAFTADIDRFLAIDADTSGIADVPALTEGLKASQRLYRLAPEVGRLDAMTALSEGGLQSAQSIIHMGRESFVASLGSALAGPDVAGSVYERAVQTAAVALTLFTQHDASMNTGLPAALSPTGATDIPPTWETLFGSLSFCACEHCRSVFSPGSYLVDLLAFVRQQPASDGTGVTPTVTESDGTVRDKTALDVLFERRPDIGEIELSCANTDTEMPTIDLVNEVLEGAVAREAAVHQTTWTADELLTNAEHQNEAAYRRLANQFYPRSLPYSLWLQEARTYLGHLGVTLDELIDVLHRPILPGAGEAALEQQIAYERLGLSPQVADIVIGSPSPGVEPWDFWGVDAAAWPSVLADLPTFLRQAELSYHELIELLSARFINPDGSVAVQFATQCNIDGATIQNLTQPVLDRMHRFVRLQHGVGWTVQELDGAITAMAARDLTPTFLVQLANIHRLGEQLGAPRMELASWWSKISTTPVGQDPAATSFYDDLFLNNAVLSPLDPAFELAADRSDLINAGSETIGDHTSAILAALAVTDAELTLVLADAGLTAGDGLTLDSLSALQRRVSLARALDLSVEDFLSVVALSGHDPFRTPRAILDHTAAAQAIAASDFSVAELDYLLRHVYEETSGLAPAESAITLVLDGIGAALQAIAAENAFVPDPTGKFTQNRLGLLLAEADVQTAMAILAGVSMASEAEQESFIDLHLAAFLDPTEAKRKLVGADALPHAQARYEYVLRPLLTYLVRTLGIQQVVQTIADALSLDVAVSEALLTRYVPAVGLPARDAIAPFLAIDPDATEHSAVALDTYRLMSKIALVLTRLQATAEELPWLFETGPSLGWLDLTQLPLATATDPAMTASLFAGWQRLVTLCGLRARYAAGDATLFGVLGLAHAGSARAAVLGELATVTGWNDEDLDFLTGPHGLDLTYPEHYRDERYLVRLEAAVAVLGRVGLSASQVARWRISNDLAAMREIARDIKSTVKAKYDIATWLTVAEPLKNTLREQQSSALVAYLIASHDSLADTSDLYARYLIDVEISACATTSRIRQGNSAVQLFVQRCLMSLEPDAEISEAAAEQWEWMKRYRVWEANRRIFMEPENYIEPELRDDKSPFFVELENQLLQSEVTDSTAQAAMMSYLQKLDEVANLDVRALVHQEADVAGDDDVLHVIARTHNTPHAYYHRTRIGSSHWTPWTSIKVDIQSDHVLAVIWNGRLYAMWPLFREVSPEVNTTTHTTQDADDVEQEKCPTLISMFETEFGEDTLTQDLEDSITDFLVPQLKDGLDNPPFDFHEAATPYVNIMKYYDDDDGNPIEPNAVYSIIDSWVACRSKPAPVTTTTTPTTSVETPMWELQLAWSEYHDGAWSTKTVSDEAIITSEGPSYSLVLEPQITPALSPDAGSTTVDDELTIACFGVSMLIKVGRGTFRFSGCGGSVIATPPDGTLVNAPPFPTGTEPFDMGLIEDREVPLSLVSGSVDEEGEWTGSDVELLTALNLTPGEFRLAIPHQWKAFVSQGQFFYQDEARSFHVTPHPVYDHPGEMVLQDESTATFDIALQWELWDQTGSLPVARESDPTSPALKSVSGIDAMQLGDLSSTGKTYEFRSFDHPYACTFLKEVAARGIDGLMQRATQALSSEYFQSAYDPVPGVVWSDHPVNNVDFTSAAANSGYNWETFFHIPLLVATRLSQNQRFDEAQQWFNRIFNPTARVDPADVTSPQRYWMFQPFYESTVPQDLNAMMASLNAGDPELEQQVALWRSDPFNPHLIARLRPAAYQKTVVMKYLDNLIAWGDILFSQDTSETIDEATLLYVLAADILGPRPQQLPANDAEDSETYSTLAPRLDDFSNALVQIENALAVTAVSATNASTAPLPTPEILYFCVPNNDQLTSYWDTVADRLFKIRHCMNIEGVVRELPLYEPPIDPNLLVQALAAGVDISSALSDFFAPLPAHRFQVMSQRAIDACGDVRSLGNALLAALKDEDAEALALLRATQETQLVDSMRTIKERQVEEAAKALESAQKSRVVVDARQQYYESLRATDLSSYEQGQLRDLEDANRIGKNAEREEIAANLLYLVPQLSVSVSVPPLSASSITEFGGLNLGQAAQAAARWHGTTATQKVYEANRASINGGHARRREEWQFQSDSAGRELDQIDVQVAGAELRLAIAEQELTNHDEQAERTRAVQDVMTSKYTNGELYGWIVSEISALHAESYGQAYDLAKRAQRAYEHEVGVVDAGFINFGYWDSLKKGLLAGEKLHHDLRRMEAAYLDDAREYEITKHISLAMIDPVALIKLRREGTCHIQLPEAQFDLDHPGAYMRRLKTVSLTIPSVAGPYTGVNCKLTLETSSIRVSSAATSTTTSAGYARSAPLDADERFRDEIGVSESVVMSVGDNDYGVFDANLDASRYLPFERRGVISTWQLELTDALPAFDYESISDVVIGLRYTAREGGELLKKACLKAIMDALRTMTSGSGNAGLMQAFSIRHEFPDDWYRFLNPAAAATSQTLELPIDESYFPYRFQGYGIQISTASLYLLPNPDATSPLMSVSAELALSNGGNASIELTPAPEPPDSNAYRPYLYAEDVALGGEPDAISLTTSEALSEQTVDNLILVLNYDISPNS